MKYLTKLSCLLLATLMVTLCLLAAPTKANAATSGYLTYEISNGEATITHADYDLSGKVTIPSTLGGCPVTCIDDFAFFGCDYITSVTIPNSVTTIGAYAFDGCTALTSVTFGKNVTDIGQYAFWGCISLPSVTIPDKVTDISNGMFDYCTSLTSVTLGKGVTRIGADAFFYCSSLTNITIPNGVTIIDNDAFWSCESLTSVTIPATVETIGYDAFYSCSSLSEIYYTGTQTQWEHIAMGLGNEQLLSVNMYFNAFPDVKSNAWYFRAVNFAVENGYFSGNGDGTFAPGKNITRQDFVVVLSRIAGANLTQYSGRTNFADVPSNAYYAKAIHWATENGIISGYNATKFGVGDSLTREQLVTILSRYAQKLGVNVAPTATAQDKMNTYADAGKINPHMKNAVAWALQNKVISGMTETTIAPQGNATRAQVANILMNINAYKVIPGI